MRQAAESHHAFDRQRPGDAATLGQIGDGLRPHGGPHPREGRAVQGHRTGGRHDRPGKRPQQGRLAGAVGAEQHREASGQRFRYEYSEQELKEWVPKIQGVSEQARETHVLMNNCYRDFAVNNARQLADLLEE